MVAVKRLQGNRSTRTERGQALVEAAIAFPLLLLVAIALVQFALFVYAQNVVTGAVQDGARVAAADGSTVADGVTRTQTLLGAGLGQSAAAVSVQGSAGTGVVTIQARGRLRTIIPWVADASLPLEAQAVMSKERFRVGPGS